MELSIIVPVYNAAKYIGRTVEALSTQDIAPYEILLIDDGSTDGSAKICDKIADTNPIVRTYHIENSGPGAARNFGIKKANGTYIAFCDADDIPSSHMYSILLNDIKRDKVDYAMCDIFTERDNKAFGFPWDGNILFEGSEVTDNLISSMLGNLSDNDSNQPVWGSCVRGIYKKQILDDNNIYFPEDIRFAEDLVFNIRYLRYVNSCFIRNEALYRYTYNPESLMNSHVEYSSTAFGQRIKLVMAITDEISILASREDLQVRFLTSQRCYFLEMVGNAARSIPEYGVRYALKELKYIVNHPAVTKAFKSYDAKSLKKRLSYWFIKNRCVYFLLIYFAYRLKA